MDLRMDGLRIGELKLPAASYGECAHSGIHDYRRVHSRRKTASYIKFTGSTSMITLHFLPYFSSTAFLASAARERISSRFRESRSSWKRNCPRTFAIGAGAGPRRVTFDETGC